MKNIEEYIKRITTYENVKYDYIDNIVLDHCYYHYDFNYRLCTEGTIYEASTSKFPKQDELVKLLINNIGANYADTVVVDVNNDFVKNIYIHFKNTNKQRVWSEYVYENIKYSDYNEIQWDNENNKFNFVEINIYNIEKDTNALEELLYHETKHIWDDYQLMIHNGINLSYVLRTHKSNKEIINDILYYGSKHENSAYLSQLNGVLKSNKYHTIKDALDDIVKSSTYQNYKYLYYYIINDKHKSDLLKEISAKEYTKIKNNIRKTWDKIIHHIYIICGEHISENRIPPTNINHFIKDKYNK